MGRPATAGSAGAVGVSIVVVNWNAGPALAACVASVPAAPGREVVLVDNASTDGSVAAVRRERPDVRVIQTGANLGFAAGANRGASESRGEVLVFLNPDARALPGAVEALVGALLLAPGAGIAGGGLVDERGRWQPGAARFAPVAHLVLDTTLCRLPARVRREAHRVDWVYGTFMAVRRDVFRALDGFDGRYFVYGEDLDLCWRAARLGARAIHVPGARAMHGRNVCAAQAFGPGRDAEVARGEMRFYAARRGRAALTAYRAVAAVKFGLKALLALAVHRQEAAVAYGRVVRACIGFAPESGNA